MKLVIFLFFLTVHSFSYAFWGPRTYQIYECSSSAQAHSCEQCKFISKGKFLVNKDQKFVISQVEIGRSKTDANCRIIDDKNWDCSSTDTTAGITTIIKNQMNDGKWIFNSRVYSETRLLFPPKDLCAK